MTGNQLTDHLLSIADEAAIIARGEDCDEGRNLSVAMIEKSIGTISANLEMNEPAAEKLKRAFGKFLNRLDDRIEAPEFVAHFGTLRSGMQAVQVLFAMCEIAKTLTHRAERRKLKSVAGPLLRDDYVYDDDETDQIAQSALELSDALDLSMLQTSRIVAAFATLLGEIS